MPDKTFTLALSDIRCVRCEVNKYRKKVLNMRQLKLRKTLKSSRQTIMKS